MLIRTYIYWKKTLYCPVCIRLKKIYNSVSIHVKCSLRVLHYLFNIHCHIMFSCNGLYTFTDLGDLDLGGHSLDNVNFVSYLFDDIIFVYFRLSWPATVIDPRALSAKVYIDDLDLDCRATAPCVGDIDMIHRGILLPCYNNIIHILGQYSHSLARVW